MINELKSFVCGGWYCDKSDERTWPDTRPSKPDAT
jgi:hypothetical protein